MNIINAFVNILSAKCYIVTNEKYNNITETTLILSNLSIFSPTKDAF